MTRDTGTPGASGGVFETIRRVDPETGGEYWSARELGPLLAYSGWQRFSAVIDKARTACEQSGYTVADHFNAVVNLIETGKGARRRVEDVHLSRYACYLVVQNGDPSKPIIAAGQSYFAIQTRRQQLADTLAGLDEAQRRLLTRAQLARQNATLADAAYDAGVTSGRDFAVFQDHGYAGLYAGEHARDIAARKGLPHKARILDHMGSEELAANLFRATQTEAKLKREGITGREAANQTHYDVGAAVRSFIIDDLGGTPPEQLPTPAESITQLQARERLQGQAQGQAREKTPARQPSLFESGESGASEETPDE